MGNYEDKIYSLDETVLGQTQAMSQVVQKTLENNGGVGNKGNDNENEMKSYNESDSENDSNG